MNSISITGTLAADVQSGDDNSFNFNVLDFNRGYGSNYFRCKLKYKTEEYENFLEMFKNIYRNKSIVRIIGNIYQNRERKSFVFVHQIFIEDITKDDLLSKAKVMFDKNDVEIIMESILSRKSD